MSDVFVSLKVIGKQKLVLEKGDLFQYIYNSYLNKLKFVSLTENFNVVGSSSPNTPHIDRGYVYHTKTKI